MHELVRAPYRDTAQDQEAEVETSRREEEREEGDWRYAQSDVVDEGVRVVVLVDRALGWRGRGGLGRELWGGGGGHCGGC